MLADHGELVAADPDRLCRAELRVETPVGVWTVRLASAIHDQPRAVHWDAAGLLVVGYGFHTYGFVARTGELRWSHRSRSPIVELLGSARLEHVLVQAEVETFAIEADGSVAWRATHSASSSSLSASKRSMSTPRGFSVHSRLSVRPSFCETTAWAASRMV